MRLATSYSNVKEAILGKPNDDDDMCICEWCSGSGEGETDGSTCYFCHGSGLTGGEADSDEYWEDSDDIPF